jgi:hypothetical protein
MYLSLPGHALTSDAPDKQQKLSSGPMTNPFGEECQKARSDRTFWGTINAECRIYLSHVIADSLAIRTLLSNTLQFLDGDSMSSLNTNIDVDRIDAFLRYFATR